MNDLRYAFRQLLKNAGFTAVSVLTLAIAIGATTASFFPGRRATKINPMEALRCE